MARISSVVLVAVDVFLRRLALPLVLLSGRWYLYGLNVPPGQSIA